MDTEHRPTRTRSTSELLDISEAYLLKRDFNNCYKYARKAQKYNPDQPAASDLLAISATLRNARTPNRPNWYKILNLPSSDAEQSAIQERFNALEGMLNPSENTYSFADEALKWVLKAGSVLCDPVRRAHVDNGGEYFWTACPYCRYIFEYENLYEDRFIKCHNEGCRRAYTAVPIGEKEPLPKEVLEKGEYVCNGFYPVPKGENLKQQASGVVSGQHSDPNVNAGAHGGQENTEDGVFIEISDNEDEVAIGGTFESRDEKCNQVKNDGTEEANNGGSVVTKRRKVMARSTKKVMGRGVRVDMDELLRKQIEDESEGSGVKQEGNSSAGGVLRKQIIDESEGSRVNQEGNNNAGVGCIGASSSKANHEGDLTLQFCAADDDIFVGLDEEFWKC